MEPAFAQSRGDVMRRASSGPEASYLGGAGKMHMPGFVGSPRRSAVFRKAAKSRNEKFATSTEVAGRYRSPECLAQK